MPLIRIENYPSEFQGNGKLVALASALRAACATARFPGIESADVVTVVAGGCQLIADGRTLLVLVELLFDKPERTKEVRDQLGHRLADHAKLHMPDGWTIEVLIMRFDCEKDTYVAVKR